MVVYSPGMLERDSEVSVLALSSRFDGPLHMDGWFIIRLCFSTRSVESF